jgi:hypothetical protein
MKAAILISGLPRFKKELVDTINNLTGYDQIDWFFYLWNDTNTSDANIPTSWVNITEDFVRSKLQAVLPANNNIAAVSIQPQVDFTLTDSWIPAMSSPPATVWKMFYGINQVNQMRLTYEAANGPYDLIIRARPDVGITSQLNLTDIKTQLDDSTVLVPNNSRITTPGNTENPINYLFAIANSNVMNTYCSVVDNMSQYNTDGVPCHGPALLAHHLTVNNISYPTTSFESIYNHYFITNELYGVPGPQDTTIYPIDYGPFE